MNTELLTTEIVRSDIQRYIKLGFPLSKIQRKIEDIHLIIMDQQDLKDFIAYDMKLEFITRSTLRDWLKKQKVVEK